MNPPDAGLSQARQDPDAGPTRVTETNTPEAPSRRDLKFAVSETAWLACASFVLAMLAAIACRRVAGVSLGLFFGPVAAATLFVPPLVQGDARGLRWIVIALAATFGATLAWLFTPVEALRWGQWVACSLVLLAYAISIGGIVSAAVALRAPRLLSAALVTLLGLLWLTWPVWLSRALLTSSGDTLVEWLVPAHPLFAINGVLVHFDSWDRLPLAYTRLSNLNQDVFYTLPGSVVPAVLVHLMIGLGCGVPAMLIALRRRRREVAASPPAAAPAVGAP
jgi:hypothetical protein